MLIDEAVRWARLYRDRCWVRSTRLFVLPHSADLYAAYLGAAGWTAWCRRVLLSVAEALRGAYFPTVGELLVGVAGSELVPYPLSRRAPGAYHSREALLVTAADVPATAAL